MSRPQPAPAPPRRGSRCKNVVIPIDLVTQQAQRPSPSRARAAPTPSWSCPGAGRSWRPAGHHRPGRRGHPPGRRPARPGSRPHHLRPGARPRQRRPVRPGGRRRVPGRHGQCHRRARRSRPASPSRRSTHPTASRSPATGAPSTWWARAVPTSGAGFSPSRPPPGPPWPPDRFRPLRDRRSRGPCRPPRRVSFWWSTRPTTGSIRCRVHLHRPAAPVRLPARPVGGRLIGHRASDRHRARPGRHRGLHRRRVRRGDPLSSPPPRPSAGPSRCARAPRRWPWRPAP